MIELLKGLLGFVTFLVLYLWIIVFFVLHRFLERWPRTQSKGADWHRNVAAGLWLASATGLWLLWTYILPDWWIAATPMLTFDR